MFRSKRKTEFVTPEFYKDWANASAELESIGRRLDAVRTAIKYLEDGKVAENHWALRHWRSIEQVMLRRWHHTIRLKDVGMRQVTKRQDSPDIDYSWWEPSTEISMNFPLFDNIGNWINDRFGFTYSDLNASWENAKEEKLQKARQGLA